jgi:hypothetical protein
MAKRDRLWQQPGRGVDSRDWLSRWDVFPSDWFMTLRSSDDPTINVQSGPVCDPEIMIAPTGLKPRC